MFDGGLFAGALTGSLFDMAASALNSADAAEESQREYERQKEFAQNSIQWRAADAKAAGIHPLAAIGGSGASYSPSGSVGGGFGDALGRTGQALSRAVSNSFSAERKLQRESMQLDLDLKKEALNQERAKTASMTSDLLKVGQAPQPMQSANRPKAAPMAVPKGASFTGNKAANKEKAVAQVLRNGNGFSILPSSDYADSADALPGSGFQAFLDKHSDPQYWFDLVRNQLPPPPPGKKYIMARSVGTGWNIELEDADKRVGRGLFRYDPNYKEPQRRSFKPRGRTPLTDMRESRRERSQKPSRTGKPRPFTKADPKTSPRVNNPRRF